MPDPKPNIKEAQKSKGFGNINIIISRAPFLQGRFYEKVVKSSSLLSHNRPWIREVDGQVTVP